MTLKHIHVVPILVELDELCNMTDTIAPQNAVECGIFFENVGTGASQFFKKNRNFQNLQKSFKISICDHTPIFSTWQTPWDKFRGRNLTKSGRNSGFDIFMCF